MYCPYGNIMNFSRTSGIGSLSRMTQNAIKINGQKNSKNLPFPRGMRTPYKTPISGPTPFPPQTAVQSLHAPLRCNYATNSPLVIMGCTTFIAEMVPSRGDFHPRLLALSIDPADPLYQTASRSNQPFSTIHRIDRQTDRQTDRWDRRHHLYQNPLTLYRL